MRKLIPWLLLALALALPARGAVRVTPAEDDTPARLSQARADIEGREVGRYGMTPISGAAVADGAYPVRVESSSPYFRVKDATLTASGGVLTLEFLIGSDSYSRVCLGSALEAETGAWIEAAPDGEGARFTVPVPGLNQPFALAAYSRRREKWYDRQLLVDASSLPEGALAFALPDYALIERALLAYEPGIAPGPSPAPAAEPVAVDRPDGEYAVEVSLTGGSGRASVSSPTLMIVREGRAWARLLWSSSHYDYMLVGGARYENLSAEGANSSFEIPIAAMDAPMDVVADTTAMGDPVEIAYQLTFYAESVGDKSQVPQEAAKRVLVISLAVIALGGVLNHILKRKRR